MPPSEIARRRAAAKREASEHYAARRAELIKAAAKVFREKGFRAASMDDIAKVAGTDRATVYYYASSKKELFDDVVRDAFEANTVRAEEIRDGDGSPREKLARVIEELMVSYGANPYLFVFVQEDAAKLGKGGGGKRLLALSRRFEDAVIGIVEDGIADGSFRGDVPARIAAYGIIGMVNWSHRWFRPKARHDAHEIGRAFATMAVEGLVQRGA